MRHRWLIALCAAALLGACAKPEGGDAAKMEMRVYHVPAEQTEALSNAIGNVLGTAYDKTSFGKVSSPAPGQLVVLAPASLQGSIESTLRDLTKAAATESKTSPKDESPLRLSFWSVDAVPGNGADDATLASLAPALDEARKQIGAVHFVLHDQATSVSVLGRAVDRNWLGKPINGGALFNKLEYTIGKSTQGYSLTFRFSEQMPQSNGQYASIGNNTTTSIRDGQTLILTQTPLINDKSDDKPQATTRLYIVRVDEVKAG